jgi:hypothetical protein
MIKIEDEQLLSLRQAIVRIPGRPHLSTLFRWMNRGVRGVCLETVVVGGRRFTSAEAIQRFIRATNPSAMGQPFPRRTAEHEAARRRLDAEGM